MYTTNINTQSPISSYSSITQRNIVLDTADNLTQIGHWALECFGKEKDRIELFLTLTRKNLDALEGYPLSPSFGPDFNRVRRNFHKLEEEYHAGIVDRTIWGNGMLKWGSTLSRSSEFI